MGREGVPNEREAACQCGHVMGAQTPEILAEIVTAHITAVHPTMRVAPLEELALLIRKARMYGPHARPTFLLYPKRDNA